MKKTIAILGIASAFILMSGVYIFTQNGSGNQVLSEKVPPQFHQYFWSETCVHCANVAEFMNTWEGKDKLEMDKYEVNESEENRKLFIENGADICKIPTNKLGVPLLVTPEGKCFFGDTPIIEYLKGLSI